MAAKARLTAFACAVMIPIFIVCVNLKAFWIASALLMLWFSVRSLGNLIIVNFASDGVYEKYMSRAERSTSAAAALIDAFLVCGAYAIIIMMLFVSLFITESSLMKVFALILLGMWGFDFCKVVSKPDDSEDWTWADTVKEIIMWSQSILSVLFAVVSIFML